MIKLAQQCCLPTAPHLRPDGADVSDSQYQKKLEPFRGLHALHKGADRLRVANVELEGGTAHQKVPAHEPRDCFGLLVREPQPWAEPQRYLLADFRMIAAAALCDVVQQYREVKSTTRHDRRRQLGCKRELVFEEPGFDLMQDPDREQRMLVDRVDMVHVILHLCDDASKIGDEAAEYSGLVHPAQRRFRTFARGQDFEEHAVG